MKKTQHKNGIDKSRAKEKRLENMAILVADDREYKTSIELVALDFINDESTESGEIWQRYRLAINHGRHMLDMPAPGQAGRFADSCVLLRSPKDEIELLTRSLDKILFEDKDKQENPLAAKTPEQISFEPFEPSFELRVERQDNDGFRVYLWLNTGNIETEIYRWDSLGLRLFVDRAGLHSFTEDLRKEFTQALPC